MIVNIDKLAKKAQQMTVNNIDGVEFEVTSTSKKTYTVNLSQGTCGCKWMEHNPGSRCSHIMAAEMESAKIAGLINVQVFTPDVQVGDVTTVENGMYKVVGHIEF